MQDTRYPVSATVQRVVDGQVSRVEQVFDTVAAAFKELWLIPQAVLALRVELSGSNIPAEDLACLFQLEMYNMTELYLGAEPSTDDPPTYLFPYTTEQWPVEYPPVRSINPEDYIRYYPQVLPPFTCAHFLYGLQLWVALERVEIRHFLHVPTADKDHIPAGELDPCDWTFAMHRNLKTFIVEDIPCRVQFLLGYVYIPTHVDVHLTAMNITRSFEADMVKEMVPYLPAIVKGVRMLDEATHIHVKVGPRSLLLCGKLSSDEDDKRRLILEARPNSASVFEPDRARGGFLHSLLHLVRDIFDLSVVFSLRITGDVTWISSKDDWANLLRPFQNLRTLRVGYYAPWGISGRVSALCEGLAVTSYGACHGFGDPICPRLTKLQLTDAEFSKEAIEEMYKVLAFRLTRSHPIAHYACGFRMRGKLAASRLQAAVNKLSRVVEDVRLENQNTLESYVPTSRRRSNVPRLRLLLPAVRK